MSNTARQAAEFVKAHGRFGDTEIVHLNKAELGILKDVWPHSINPETGQPEFFLQFLLPLIMPELLGLTGLEAALAAGGAGAIGGLMEGQSPANALMGGLMSGVTGGLFGGGGDAAHSLGGAAASAAGDSGGKMGGVGDLFSGKNLLPTILLGTMGSQLLGGNQGPKKEEYDPKAHPENFPEQPRVSLPAPQGYQPGTDPEHQYFYGRGYAAGGPITPEAWYAGADPEALKAFFTFGAGYPGGKAGAIQNITKGTRPTTGQPGVRPPIIPRDPGSLISGSSGIAGGAVTPTPAALPVNMAPMQYAPNNFAANLRAARPAGYAMGGEVAPGAGGGQDAMIVKAAIMALMGQSPNPEQAIQMFVQRFGKDALQDLVNRIMGGGGNGGGGRLASGPGDGLSDGIAASVDGAQPSALSSGEFVVPSDAVAHIGNGSNEAGAGQLQQMIDRARAARTGSATAPPAINPQQMMPA